MRKEIKLLSHIKMGGDTCVGWLHVPEHIWPAFPLLRSELFYFHAELCTGLSPLWEKPELFLEQIIH